MASNRLDPVLRWLKRVITQPHHELTQWQVAARYAYDLGRYGAKQLRRDRAPQMAAALAFRTLFGLLPVLVLGTMLVRAFGGFEPFHRTLGSFFGSLGLDRIQISGIGDDAALAAGATLDGWLLDLVSQVEDINLAAITWVGVIVLVYSAVSLMVTIEACFNTIFRSPEGRSWGRRLPIYWTVVTLGPAAIALTAIIDRWFDTFITENVSWFWLLKAAPVLWSFCATWLVMFAIYKLLPNTRVLAQPALIGAFVAAVLLEVGKRSMGAYLENALSIRQLYGSLGLIPLFMFWVYLMWLMVLFGLEVSSTLQMLAGRKLDEIDQTHRPTGLIDPASIIAVMEFIAGRFSVSQTATGPKIAEATGLPEPTVELMVNGLIERGLLHKIDRDDGAVTLARPPEAIEASELIEVGFSLVDDGGFGIRTPILVRLREAQRGLAAGATLAQLLPAVTPNDQAADPA